MKRYTILKNGDLMEHPTGFVVKCVDLKQAIKEAIEKVKELEITFNPKYGKKYFCQSHVIEILEGILK